jgi:hypothetical protein
MGGSFAGHLSQESRRAAARAPNAALAPTFLTEPDRALNRQRSVGDQAVIRLRPSQVPVQAVTPPARSPSQQLDPGTRRLMETRLGHDFSRVRVHSGLEAVQAARHVNATAFTVGHDVFLGANAPSPQSKDGWRLLAHELAHVVQQRGGGAGPAEAGLNAEQEADAAAAAVTEGNRFAVHGLTGVTLARQVPGGPSGVPALEPLEAVAQRIARLAVGPSSAEVAKIPEIGGPDKVVSVVRNVRTGDISVGLNTGVPARAAEPIQRALQEQARRLAAGEVNVKHTDATAMDGGHAEVNALNRAIADEQAVLGRTITAEEIARTFEMHNVWLSGSRRRFTTAPRCEHCAAITRGVKVTEALFKAEFEAEFEAEGGVSGGISVPQHGRAVKAGGKVVEAETIHGEIPAPKPTGGPSGTPPATEAGEVPMVEAGEVPMVEAGGSSEALAEHAVAGGGALAVGEVASMLSFAINWLVLPLALDFLQSWEDKKAAEAERAQIQEALIKSWPMIMTNVLQRQAELAYVTQHAKEGQTVYANVNLIIEPAQYGAGRGSYDPEPEKPEMHLYLVGVSLSTAKLQSRSGTELVVSIPLYKQEVDPSRAASSKVTI